jgi:hypothetical protein
MHRTRFVLLAVLGFAACSDNKSALIEPQFTFTGVNVEVAGFTIQGTQFINEPSCVTYESLPSVQIYYYGDPQMKQRQHRIFEWAQCSGEPVPFDGGTIDAWTVSEGVSSHIAHLPANLERYLIQDLPSDITLRLEAFPYEGCHFEHWSDHPAGVPISYNNPYFVSAGSYSLYVAKITCD